MPTTSADTESLCPVCLRRIPARRIRRDGDLYQEKSCPEHGLFSVPIWRGDPSYDEWVQGSQTIRPAVAVTGSELGCPFDCGVCPRHEQSTCCVLLELTMRCNLGCRYCFAQAGIMENQDPPLEQIADWYDFLLSVGESRPFNIQLSGGEPTLREDLREIVALGKRKGFPYIQLNTNGLRLADEAGYADGLKQAGLSSVFLQFDGTEEQIHVRIRGRELLRQKLRAIERCGEAGLGVVLVVTVVPGVNDHNLGGILHLAVESLPTVRGVQFQPVSYFGRTPAHPQEATRITIPEVLRNIERQTAGLMRIKSFRPVRVGHAACSFQGSFLKNGGELISLVEEGGSPGASCCCEPSTARMRDSIAQMWQLADGAATDSWEECVRELRRSTLTVSAMAFQDAWNLDLERLRACRVLVLSRDRKLVPFCAYYLTDSEGRRLRSRRSEAAPGQGRAKAP